MSTDYVEITTEHVGQQAIRAFGRQWLVAEFMGHIRPDDVGKRIYLRGDILQVENDEQREPLMREPSPAPEYTSEERRRLEGIAQSLCELDAEAKRAGETDTGKLWEVLGTIYREITGRDLDDDGQELADDLAEQDRRAEQSRGEA